MACVRCLALFLPLHPDVVALICHFLAVSGSISAAVMNPLDVIRTRVQVTGHTITEVIKETMVKDGIRGYARKSQYCHSLILLIRSSDDLTGLRRVLGCAWRYLAGMVRFWWAATNS